MTPLVVVGIVLLATVATMVLTRGMAIKAPVVAALFGLVLLVGFGTLLAYRRSVATAAEKACDLRVSGRDDLRGQFGNFYRIFEGAFADNNFVLGLVATARADLDKTPEQGGYPALNPDDCDHAPYIALPLTDPTVVTED